MRQAIGAASEEDVERLKVENESIKKAIIFLDREINDNRIKANILIAIVALQTFLIAMMIWAG